MVDQSRPLAPVLERRQVFKGETLNVALAGASGRYPRLIDGSARLSPRSGKVQVQASFCPEGTRISRVFVLKCTFADEPSCVYD